MVMDCLDDNVKCLFYRKNNFKQECPLHKLVITEACKEEDLSHVSDSGSEYVNSYLKANNTLPGWMLFVITSEILAVVYRSVNYQTIALNLVTLVNKWWNGWHLILPRFSDSSRVMTLEHLPSKYIITPVGIFSPLK